MSFQLPFRKKSESQEIVDMNDATSSDGVKSIPSFPFLEKPAAPEAAGTEPVAAEGTETVPGNELERLRQSLDGAVQEALRSFHAYVAALGRSQVVLAPAPAAAAPFMEPDAQLPAESFPLARIVSGDRSPAALSATLKEKLEQSLAEAFAAEPPKTVLPPPRSAPVKPVLTPPPLPVEAGIPTAAPAVMPSSPFSTVEPLPSPFAVVSLPKKEEAAPPSPSPFAYAEKAPSVPPPVPADAPAPPPPAAEAAPLPFNPPPLPANIPDAPTPFSFAPAAPPSVPAPPAQSAAVAEAPAPLPFSPFQGLEPAPPPPMLDKAAAPPLSGVAPPIIAENAPAWSTGSPSAAVPPPAVAIAPENVAEAAIAAAKSVETPVLTEENPPSVLRVATPPVPVGIEPLPAKASPAGLAAFSAPEASAEAAPPQPLFGSTQAATAPFRLGGEAAPAASTAFNPFAPPPSPAAPESAAGADKPAPPALESTPSPTQRLSEPTEPPMEIAFNFAEMLRAASQRPS